MKNDFINRIFRGDKGIWFIFMFLCMISIIEVFSATSQMSYDSGNFWGPISSHCIHMLIGVAMVIIVHLLPYKYWKVLGPVLLGISLVLLIYLVVAGKAINGGARWIRIFGFTLQPSEIAKLAVIMTVALLLSRMDTEDLRSSWKTYGWIMGITIVFCAFIALENLSTAGLLFVVVVIMTLIGGVPKRITLPIYGAGALLVGLVLAFFVLTPQKTMKWVAEKTPLHRADTWQKRIKGFVVVLPDNPSDYRISDENRQISHALIAVASSGIVGTGPGNSVQRDFLSHADCDFIFAIILEELGLVGAIFVLLLYVALLVRVGKIARKCPSRFSALLVMGCALMLVTQAFTHMLISVNMFPVTGQPLPLISRGGTSVIISCMYIGIILNVSYLVGTDDAQNEDIYNPQILIPNANS
jgi:Bacterial cell division membrane protein